MALAGGACEPGSDAGDAQAQHNRRPGHGEQEQISNKAVSVADGRAALRILRVIVDGDLITRPCRRDPGLLEFDVAALGSGERNPRQQLWWRIPPRQTGASSFPVAPGTRARSVAASIVERASGIEV
jgi:hypothetical protein